MIVAVFCLLVLIIFGYGVRFLFEVLQNEPIALGMVLILSIQPVLVLLAIFAVRGGDDGAKKRREETQDMLDAISGNAMPQMDLKSLREARMKK
ncbi:MAG: hypothetical protein ABGW81_00715 [Paracoccaceae bacterium]